MKNLNELPEILEISDLMDYLGISRSGAYRLVRKKDSRRSNCWADIQYRKHR